MENVRIDNKKKKKKKTSGIRNSTLGREERKRLLQW